MTLLLFFGFVAIQLVVLVVAIGCYAHRLSLFYYAALYAPAIVFAGTAGLLGGDDWIAVFIVQAILSLVYNLHISSSKQRE
jgi:hypothetical protein